MANISSVGIGSGVLTSDLIDKLVAAEKEPTEKRLDAKEEEITTELSVFGQIQSAVTDFRLPSRSLSDPNLFNSLNVEGSSSAFNVEASSSASPGTYTLKVDNVATAHSLSTAEFADADATQVGEGSLDITVNGETTTITIDSSNNTLNGIAAAINDEDDLAVTASVINTGTGFKLVLSSDETGLDNAIEIAVTDTGDGNNLDANGLSQLSYVTGAQNLTENQAALDANFSFNGIAITRGSNTVDDLIEGLTLNLTGENTSAETFNVVRDEDLIVEKVQEFVDKFNALQQIIAENTIFNPDNPAASGVLVGDSSTRTVMTQIQSVLGQTIRGLESATIRSASEVGISTNKDTGQLVFNSDTFKSKLAESPSDIAAIFADQGRTTDGQVEFVRAGSATQVGTYDIQIDQVATRGGYTGSVALSGATTIDADNDELSITVDGITSGALTLTAGAYTDAQLVAEIQAQIDADANLRNSGVDVTVSLDGSNQLQFTSASYGRASRVDITSNDTNSLAQLGLGVATGTQGLDVAGTINGVVARGNGQFLTSGEGESTRGFYEGTAALSGSTVIDTDNDELSLSIDGIASGTITLAAGTYTNEELAAELQSKINADSALSAAGKAVAVSLDENSQIVISSITEGSASKVSITSVDTNTSSELGLTVGSGTDGTTVTSSTGVNNSESIVLKITGSATGNRGSVSYIEGIGEQMVDLINGFLGANGPITTKNDGLNAQLDEIAKDRVSLNLRIESLNARLVRQFTSADIAISRLNSTADFVKQQLDALAPSKDD